MKYNPGFLSPEQLEESFIVRQSDLDGIVRVVRENTGTSNQHVLVVGARGMGKTTLVHRVVVEIKKDPELAARWYPVLYAEESYFADSAARFWLEALLHIGRQTGDLRWKTAYEDLKKERDENRMRERALAAILDFADLQKRRLLLIVENLNMLLEELIKPAEAWALRHTLQNEPRVMLLATATSESSGVKDADKALFDLFRVHQLLPLSVEECTRFWSLKNSSELSFARARQIQILTGGNPRLLAIIVAFGRQLSFRNLMQELLHLVDDHTDYFKSHLEALPAGERKVYLALAEIWSPATAADIDGYLHIGVHQISSFLSRLESRGAVVVPGLRPTRPRRYQVSERLYNIYWLLRRHGDAAERVRGLITIMEAFYPGGKILDLVSSLTEEACKLGDKDRCYHIAAYEEFVRRINNDRVRSRLIDHTSSEFWNIPELPETILTFKAAALATKNKSGVERTLAKLLNRVEGDPDDLASWAELATKYYMPEKRYAEAADAFRRVAEKIKNIGSIWFGWAVAEANLSNYKEAARVLTLGTTSLPNDHRLWSLLGKVLVVDRRFGESEAAFQKATKLKSDDAFSWAMLAFSLDMNRENKADAEAAYRTALKLEPNQMVSLLGLADVLSRDEDRHVESEALYRKAIELEPTTVPAIFGLTELLISDVKHQVESNRLIGRVLEIDPDHLPAKRWRIRAMLQNSETRTAGFVIAKDWFRDNPGDYHLFIGIMMDTCALDLLDDFEWALDVACQCAKVSPCSEWFLVICWLLIGLDRIDEAVESYRQATGYKISELSEIFMTKFAILMVGHQADANVIIDIVNKSEAAARLEALIVALRLYNGEEVNAPAEVLTVAQDIAQSLLTDEK